MRRWLPYAAGGAAGVVIAVAALAASGVFAGSSSAADRARQRSRHCGEGTARGGQGARKRRPQAAPTGTASPLDIRAVLRAVEPGVVVITDFTAGSTGSTRASAQGTGMVLDTLGDVLTNAHVVASATTVSVQVFGQPTVYQAKVLGVDAADDVALIQIQNPGKLTPIPLGTSAGRRSATRSSRSAMPSASPRRPDVTSGIISALGRSLSTNTERLTGLLQTDAALNRATPAAPSPMPPAR